MIFNVLWYQQLLYGNILTATNKPSIHSALHGNVSVMYCQLRPCQQYAENHLALMYVSIDASEDIFQVCLL